MTTSRTAVRALRTIRTRPTTQSIAFRARPAWRRTYADGASSTSSTMNPALIGGAAGGGLVFALAYGWYYMSGAKTAINSIHTTKSYFDKSVKKLQDSAPEPSEAMHWLRETALSYSAAIPGAKGYVNKAFDDLDLIHDKHADEVDKIVKDTYAELKEITKKGGLDVETAYKVWNILGEKLKQITSLAGDAAEDILDNHPYVKQKVGGSFKQLRQLGDELGPQAKEEINKTYEQVQDILKKGFSGSTVGEIQSLIQEKSEMLRNLSNEAWKKGMEQAKPYFDKNPQLKKVVEENADALKTGNISELWDKVKQAASSGSTKDLEQYAKQASEKAKQGGQAMGFDFSKLTSMIPGGADISEKWEQLVTIGEKHGKEAQDLLESTVHEIKEVLAKKVQDGQKLAEKAKKSAS